MAHGAGLTVAADAITSLLYSGEKTDITGLQYLRARFYDPSVGRFNRLDPFGGNMQDPLSLHKYLYVHASPVMRFDPTGMFSLGSVGVANSIGSMLSAMTAQAGQAVAAAIGYNLYADPIDVLLSREVGLLPDAVYDAIDTGFSYVIENADQLGFALGTVVVAGVYTSTGTSLGSKIRQHFDDLLNVNQKTARFTHDQFVRSVRPGAREAVFYPLSAGQLLGSRRFDDFDEISGIAFEGNTTPWSQMTGDQLQRKLEQAGSDLLLLNSDPRIKRIVWFGTEPLPSHGRAGQLRAALDEAGIDYWVVAT